MLLIVARLRQLVMAVVNSGGSCIRAAELQHPPTFFYALDLILFFSLPFFEVLLPNFFSFHGLIMYEYKYFNGIPVLSAAQVFSYANEPNGDATKAIDDVFGLAVQFLYELHCWQIKAWNSD